MLIAVILFFVGCSKDPALAPVKPIANAGLSLSVQLPTNTVSVAGSGTTTNGSIVGYLWSLVSGPNVPVITSPASASTAINGLIAGTYIFQFAVTDNVGLTGVDTMSVVVNPAVQQTVTIQPTNNPNDIHVDSKLLGFGSDIEIPIGSWTIGGGQENYRAYYKFDQSLIPASATIISATLYLYAIPNPNGGNLTDAHFGTANGFFVERVTAAWNPAGYNWNNQAPSTSVNRVTVAQSISAFENATINVTGIVQDMQTSGNYGFIFRMQNEVYYNIRQYVSSFHSNASLHPKLVITYQ